MHDGVDRPVVSPYRPALQLVQAPAPPTLNLPVPQMAAVPLVDPGTQAYPAVQCSCRCTRPTADPQSRRTGPHYKACTRQHHRHCTDRRHTSQPLRWSTPVHTRTPRCSSRCSSRSSCPTERHTNLHCTVCTHQRHPNCTDPTDMPAPWRLLTLASKQTPLHMVHCTTTTPGRWSPHRSLPDMVLCMLQWTKLSWRHTIPRCNLCTSMTCSH